MIDLYGFYDEPEEQPRRKPIRQPTSIRSWMYWLLHLEYAALLDRAIRGLASAAHKLRVDFSDAATEMWKIRQVRIIVGLAAVMYALLFVVAL